MKFDSCDTYLKTELTGGYNAKWGMPKGQYESFSKGSTIVLKNYSFETLNETMFPFFSVIFNESTSPISNISRRIDSKLRPSKS